MSKHGLCVSVQQGRRRFLFSLTLAGRRNSVSTGGNTYSISIWTAHKAVEMMLTAGNFLVVMIFPAPVLLCNNNE